MDEPSTWDAIDMFVHAGSFAWLQIKFAPLRGCWNSEYLGATEWLTVFDEDRGHPVYIGVREKMKWEVGV